MQPAKFLIITLLNLKIKPIKMKILFIFIHLSIYCCFSQDVYSQKWKKPNNYELKRIDINKKNYNGIKAVTVDKNDRSRDIIPSKDAERFKTKVEINKDSVSFTLKADRLQYGNFVKSFLDETIMFQPNLMNDETIFFEIVPDVSKINNLILFSYFPGMTGFRYMHVPEGKRIKYKLFEKPIDNSNIVPLMLLYMDDEDKHVELFLNSKLTNGYIPSSFKEYRKIFDKIELCMFVYYKIE